MLNTYFRVMLKLQSYSLDDGPYHMLLCNLSCKNICKESRCTACKFIALLGLTNELKDCNLCVCALELDKSLRGAALSVHGIFGVELSF
jgi:hypothetical protein